MTLQQEVRFHVNMTLVLLQVWTSRGFWLEPVCHSAKTNQRTCGDTLRSSSRSGEGFCPASRLSSKCFVLNVLDQGLGSYHQMTWQR